VVSNERKKDQTMSKKKTTSQKTSTKKAKRATSDKATAATETVAADATDAADGATGESASRLPPVGTVIKKVDRHGAVRCQCTVVEDGVRYKGRVFPSISGAAMAAAQDLGLKNKTQNGFTFWGLVKPSRKLEDPEAALQKSSDRFQKLAVAALQAATEKNRPQVRAVLESHENVIQGLLGEAAA
jgi:hypothetical protein